MNESILKKYVLILIIAWSLIVCIILFFGLKHLDNDADLAAKTEAISNFNKDQSIRHWASKQGGIYVEISSHTLPNPNLAHIKDRDIETLHGKKLTLMNPAYIVRQLNEYFADEYGIVGHITSTKLLRPENKPDAWELDALLQFETGINEVSGYSEINGNPYYRYIQPMMTLKSCLKCHDMQGYKVGDVRGGVSISVPIQHIIDRASKIKQHNIISFTLLWLAGLLGLILGWINLKKSFKKQRQLEYSKFESDEKFRVLYHNSPDMCVSVSPEDARIILCNETLLKKTGYSEKEVIGSPIFKIYHEDCMAEVKKVFEQFVETGEVKEKELILKTKDGTKIPVSLNVNAVKDLSGKIIYSISSWRDITQSKKISDELKEYRENLEELVKTRTEEIETINEELTASNEDLQMTNDKLNKANKDLEEFNELFIGREFRIKELRDKVKELEARIKS